MNKKRIGGGVVLGESAKHDEARGHPKGGYVDAPVVRRKSAFLPGETCSGAEKAS
jgi:hypothetical protein